MTIEKKTLVYLGLGSSEGTQEEKEIMIIQSGEEIKKLGNYFKLSSFFYSKPWGGVAKNNFVNAVCSIEISMSAEELLKNTQRIENLFGRKRDIHWDDRSLDIDILLYGKNKIKTDILIIPHRYMWDRDFVYQPLKELMGEKKFEEYKKIILS